MTNQRFHQIFTLALTAKRSLDKFGSLQRNKLPRVTVQEHHELVSRHPKMAAFTRCFEYNDNDYVEDTNRMSSSRLPKVTEIWVGARSLGCIPGESAETESEGLSASQLAQEDAAELTDLQTMLYHDAATGECLITDEDGVERPVRNGDVITVVRGSNDDLDALFLEEGDDPRMQNDHTAEGTDHKWSGRFRANTELEEKFLHDRSYRLPNSATPEGVKWEPNDFTIRRSAAKLVETIIARRPEWAANTLALTDEAERRIRAMAGNLSFDHEGAMIRGHFISRDEFFGTIEANAREYEAAIAQPKAAPSAVDWSQIRSPSQKRKRQQLEASLQ